MKSSSPGITARPPHEPVDLIHAVDEFHNPFPAYVALVVGVVQFGDSDGVANLDTMR